MDIRYFATPAAFREWLAANHEKCEEQWVGYWKKHTGHPSITWEESVDEALCVGWIDGLRRRVDDDRYTIRFTPRKPRSNWSDKNIRRYRELLAEGRVTPAGEAAFADGRVDDKRPYTYEQNPETLPPAFRSRLEANPEAREFFDALAPSYRKSSILWVLSAKREETRLRRLDTLIASSADGEKIPPLTISRKKTGR